MKDYINSGFVEFELAKRYVLDRQYLDRELTQVWVGMAIREVSKCFAKIPKLKLERNSD